jgi:hypothetical protein
MIKKEKYLVLAGGRIRCHRCQAKSKRTGLQCSAPAMAGKVVCSKHGGRSCGPKTEAGKRRIAAANFKHGLYTRQAITERQEIAARIAQLEDVMYLAKMTDAPRTRGRKPVRYEPVMSLEDVPRMLGIGRNRSDDDEQEIYP